MGPGARHDCVDCHWSHWNRQKLIQMGLYVCVWNGAFSLLNLIARTLQWRLNVVVEELETQEEGFLVFMGQQAERVVGWKKMVVEFEADGLNKNPYEVVVNGELYYARNTLH
jgi:hypothetical protein